VRRSSVRYTREGSEVLTTVLPLHWLTGGVWTLHLPGSSSALALTVTPNDDAAPPPSTAQRHRGAPRTTPASAEQHDAPGADVFPAVKERHGARLRIDAVQPDVACAAHRGAATTTSSAAATATAATANPRRPPSADEPRAIGARTVLLQTYSGE
jgi:hypothetical protein